jgi:hypothetical protein
LRLQLNPALAFARVDRRQEDAACPAQLSALALSSIARFSGFGPSPVERALLRPNRQLVVD